MPKVSDYELDHLDDERLEKREKRKKQVKERKYSEKRDHRAE